MSPRGAPKARPGRAWAYWLKQRRTPLAERGVYQREGPIGRARIVAKALLRLGYRIPSDATFVRLCEGVTRICALTGRPWSFDRVCNYPLTFFEEEPPENMPAGEVVCPCCGAKQPACADGTIPRSLIYKLPPYSDPYVNEGGDLCLERLTPSPPLSEETRSPRRRRRARPKARSARTR